MNETLTARAALSFGWETFKKRPWFFVGAFAVVMLASIAVNIAGSIVGSILGEHAKDILDPLVSWTVNIFAGIGFTMLYLSAHDAIAQTTLGTLWYPKPFWRYLGLSIVMTVALILGFLALIIPGIILALAFSFAAPLVVEKDLGPIEALKESMRLTKGHRWMLLRLALLSVLVNILRLCALIVGVLATAPVTALAFIHAYRVLSGTSANSSTTEEVAPTLPKEAVA